MLTVGFASRVNKKTRKNNFLPQIKYGDLPPLTVYKITKARRVTSEYGPAIVIDLDNESCMFLPKSTFRKFEGEDGEEDFQELLQVIRVNKIGYRKTADGLDELVDL